MRVLFVDDDPDVLTILGSYCQALELPYVVASSAEAALATCATEPVEVVVTDLNMPECDGFALARRIREAHPEVAIFAMTSSSLCLTRDAEALFDRLFRKPNEFSWILGEVLKRMACRRYPFLA